REEFRIFHIDITRRRTPVTRNQMVFGSIDSDAVHPGVKRTVPAEIWQGPIGFYKGVLSNIMNFRMITDKATDNSQDFVLVFDNEQIKGALVAFLHPFYQLLIGIWCQ